MKLIIFTLATLATLVTGAQYKVEMEGIKQESNQANVIEVDFSIEKPIISGLATVVDGTKTKSNVRQIYACLYRPKSWYYRLLRKCDIRTKKDVTSSYDLTPYQTQNFDLYLNNLLRNNNGWIEKQEFQVSIREAGRFLFKTVGSSDIFQIKPESG